MEGRKSFVFKEGDLALDGGRLLVVERLDAIKEILRARLLIQKGEDENNPRLGLPWVEYFNSEMSDFDFRLAIVDQMKDTGLIYRASIRSFEKEAGEVRIGLDVQYQEEVLSFNVNYYKE